MAYIQPNSIVQFFGDLGISPNYENSLYFASTSAKDSYFDGLTKKAIATSLSYNRENRGFIRVEIPMSSMYNVGYMRFKNTSFENKWFYAFVTQVNYINNVTTEVQFELDVLMTWMGTFQLGQCFIERQHSETDAIGDNIVDECIPCGDLKNEEVVSSGYIGSNGFWYCFASTFDPTNPSQNADGGIYGGIYSGVKLTYTNDPDSINTWITTATSAGKSDGIVGISLVPYSFITDDGDAPVERAQTFPKPYTNVDGYTPKNNKLFIYPYKSIQCTNMEGNFAEFRYEFFGGNSAQFQFIGTTGLNTEIVCAPVNYKGVQENITEKISMSDFPLCAYAIDSFKAWLAQNKSSIAANAISSAGSLVGSLALANTVTSAVSAYNIGQSAASNIIGQIGQLKDYARKPPQAGGSQGNYTLFGRTTGRPKKDFWFIKKTITRQYAKIIDDYFTMYGYKQNTVSVPNMNVRPYYTYIKTIGCIVHGDLPSDDGAEIERVFDTGIRFWKNHTQIGNYSLNNSPA